MAAATFRKSLRTSDYAFRIGGDEFALLLPQSDTEQAATLSRRFAPRMRVPRADESGNSTGTGLWLAVYPDDGELQETLIRVADERLYRLKNETRSASGAASRPDTGEGNSFYGRAGLPNLPYVEPPPESETKKIVDRRRWERFSMSETNAYALIGENPQRKARVLNLGHGGICLEAPRWRNSAKHFMPYCTCRFFRPYA